MGVSKRLNPVRRNASRFKKFSSCKESMQGARGGREAAAALTHVERKRIEDAVLK